MSYTIVVGASVGGVQAMMKLAGSLPAELGAAIFVSVHTGARGPRFLPDLLSRAGPLPATYARDGEAIRPGRIFVAPVGHHLVVLPKLMHVIPDGRGGRQKPWIDELFRSAALSHGQNVIAVLLTGALNDGTAGLSAVKRCGGVAVVQDPQEASVASMPRSAIKNVPVDHCVPVAEMGPLLDQLSRRAISARPSSSPTADSPALPFPTVSPERKVEEALWAAVEALDQKATLSDRLAVRISTSVPVAHAFRVKAEAARTQAETLRQMIATLPVVS
jgi:two-component system chemotaxis response regulator CheB